MNTPRLLSALLLPCVCFLFVSALFGCGGGTVGTGSVGTKQLQGVVVDPEGAPLPNVQVISPETGESAVTDARGEFTLQVVLDNQTVQLTFISQSGPAEVSFEVPVSGAEGVKASFELNDESATVSVLSVSVAAVDPSAEEQTNRPTAPSSKTPSEEHTIRWRGTMSFEDGLPVEGAKIRIARKSTRTNSHGEFRLTTSAAHKRFVIVVEYQDLRDEITVDDLPGNRDLEVRLRLVLHTGGQGPSLSGLLELDDIEVIER